MKIFIGGERSKAKYFRFFKFSLSIYFHAPQRKIPEKNGCQNKNNASTKIVSLSRNTEQRKEGRKNLILSRLKLKQYTIENNRILKTSIEQKMMNLKVGKDSTNIQLVFEQTNPRKV